MKLSDLILSLHQDLAKNGDNDVVLVIRTNGKIGACVPVDGVKPLMVKTDCGDIVHITQLFSDIKFEVR